MKKKITKKVEYIKISTQLKNKERVLQNQLRINKRLKDKAKNNLPANKIKLNKSIDINHLQHQLKKSQHNNIQIKKELKRKNMELNQKTALSHNLKIQLQRIISRNDHNFINILKSANKSSFTIHDIQHILQQEQYKLINDTTNSNNNENNISSLYTINKKQKLNNNSDIRQPFQPLNNTSSSSSSAQISKIPNNVANNTFDFTAIEPSVALLQSNMMNQLFQ